ncbi:MAG: Chromatin structure remodeling complex protein sfh1 [Cirrosporium novae-zelandiae]|nr:MAG: Chromatin structure remodeling complex protein sfh1 [Cirrosporium novae-zelandiae]
MDRPQRRLKMPGIGPKSAPQAFMASYAPRLRTYGNALMAPVIPNATQTPLVRMTKRGTTAINYAEDGFDDEDFEDSDRLRRPTGLRSLRHEQSQDRPHATEKLGLELRGPVEIQGIWRDWMAKPKVSRTEKQLHAQDQLPVTLIPIRIDLEIPAFIPERPMPLPPNFNEFGIDPNKPAYKTPDPVPQYRIKDVFLWNLHETLMTPEEFALQFVRDLDLPHQGNLVVQISDQIRQQLEQYAGVALHPLFQHSTQGKTTSGTALQPVRAGLSRTESRMDSRTQSRAASRTPARTPGQITDFATPLTNGHPETNGSTSPSVLPDSITATAEPLSEVNDTDELNPDDTYRCTINLTINLINKLYTDKFEWSLLHPPGFAEHFARQTCADIGLPAEWVPVMTHAIYEAVLRLKKEACESGGLIAGISYGGEMDNQAADPKLEAGWRYDDENLCEEWSPSVEILSKEEIEKREGDRERQIRRIRRETARFSSSAVMNLNLGWENGIDSNAETPMGRGERRKRRRFRSASPNARSGTPMGRGTPEGYGGAGGNLTDYERQTWRCAHCLVWGNAVWAVRDGPAGPRTLCNNCGLIYERERKLPSSTKDLHRSDIPIVPR